MWGVGTKIGTTGLWQLIQTKCPKSLVSAETESPQAAHRCVWFIHQLQIPDELGGRASAPLNSEMKCLYQKDSLWLSFALLQ